MTLNEQLNKLLRQMVFVIKPLSKTCVVSFCGELYDAIGDNYQIHGNPSLLFNISDVDKVEAQASGTPVIRLTK